MTPECSPLTKLRRFFFFRRPQDGADPIYDEKCHKIQLTKNELDKELQNLQQKYPKVSRSMFFFFQPLYFLEKSVFESL